MESTKKGPPSEPGAAGPVGAGAVLDVKRRGRSRKEFLPTICRYCGGMIRLVPAETVYGASAARLGKRNEKIYQCQNCGARVGCHKGTVRPLGNIANEMLRLKRVETHQIFDAFWKRRHISRTAAYRWLAEKMELPEGAAHIGDFEMDQCQKVIDLCRSEGGPCHA